jgi:hypothetical protein
MVIEISDLSLMLAIAALTIAIASVVYTLWNY